MSIALSAAAAVMAGACGASSQTQLSVGEFVPPEDPPEALDLDAVFFMPGEQMSFELSLRGVVGGEASTAVGVPGYVDGRHVVIVRSHLQSSGVVAVVKEVRDEVTTWVDVDSGRPIKHLADTKYGDKEAIISTSFNDGQPGDFVIDYQRDGRNELHYRQSLPDGVVAFDAHAILGVLRAWQPGEGEHAAFYVIAGRRLWRNSIRFSGRETVRTALGRFPTIRIDGVAHRVGRKLQSDTRKPPRHYTIWLSDDGSRLPLLVLARTEYGDVRVELTDYARPDQRITRVAPKD